MVHYLSVPSAAFQVSGVTAIVRSPIALPPSYRPIEIPSAPAVVIDVDHDREMETRPALPDHPAFAKRSEGRALLVERGDVEGRIDLDAEPLRARFRIADNVNALESCLRVSLSLALPRHGALILHASAVRWDGEAHVFTGVSGAGKSTIAEMLATRNGCERLADEILVIRREPPRWTLEVPPFIGLAGLPRGERAPLASIDLLAQAPAHRRTALSPAAAMRQLLRHVIVYAAEPATTELVLALVNDLCSEVPCHQLEFAKDPSVGDIVGASR